MQSRFILENTAREWNASSANFLTEKLAGNTELKVTAEDKAIRSLVKVIHPLEFPHSRCTLVHKHTYTYHHLPTRAARRQLQLRPPLKSRSNEWNEITISSSSSSSSFRSRHHQIRNLSHSNLSPLVTAETRHARYEPVHSPVSKLDTLETREDVVLIFQFPMSRTL